MVPTVDRELRLAAVWSIDHAGRGTPSCRSQAQELLPLPERCHRMDEATHALTQIAAARERLIAAAGPLTGAQVREPSPLPGWARGHVLTHLARNPDGLRNLLIW